MTTCDPSSLTPAPHTPHLTPPTICIPILTVGNEFNETFCVVLRVRLDQQIITHRLSNRDGGHRLQYGGSESRKQPANPCGPRHVRGESHGPVPRGLPLEPHLRCVAKRVCCVGPRVARDVIDVGGERCVLVSLCARCVRWLYVCMYIMDEIALS